jgi:hypothetical protein
MHNDRTRDDIHACGCITACVCYFDLLPAREATSIVGVGGCGHLAAGLVDLVDREDIPVVFNLSCKYQSISVDFHYSTTSGPTSCVTPC